MLNRIKDAWNKRRAEKNLSKGKTSILGDEPVYYEKLDDDFNVRTDGARVNLNSEYKEVIPTYYDENGKPRN